MISIIDALPDLLRLHALWLEREKTGQRAELPRQNLRGALLPHADLRYAVFTQANLRGADLSYADLSHADLRGADLRGANFHGAFLYHTSFCEANLIGACFVQAQGEEGDFRKARLTGVDWSGANLTRASLEGADIRQSQWAGTNLHGTILSPHTLPEADLAGPRISHTLFGTTRILQFFPVGSRHDALILKQFADGTTEAMTGCFTGTLEELALTVEEIHKTHPDHLHDYRAAIAYGRALWNLPEQKGEE